MRESRRLCYDAAAALQRADDGKVPEYRQFRPVGELRGFPGELRIQLSALDQVIIVLYDPLGQMTFLTTGEREVRVWAIERKTKRREPPERFTPILGRFTRRDRVLRRLRATSLDRGAEQRRLMAQRRP